MITVLIVNGNKEFFSSLNSDLKFKFSTKNTSTFEISESKFEEMKNEIFLRGINPYSIMNW